MKFRMEIDCGNAAFGDNATSCAAELANILEMIAEHITDTGLTAGYRGMVVDTDSSEVGFYVAEG